MKKNKNWYSKVKNRLHFDTKVCRSKASKIIRPENVIHHAFYPFVYFEIKQFKLSKKHEQKTDPNISIIDPYKRRDIYYSCHSDSYIYSYYNEILLSQYEKYLKNNCLDCSIAYRHIDKNSNSTGMSNIDFAAEAFKEIDLRKNCYVLGLDIHGFFDNLDHEILYKNLCKILEEEKLSEHWYKIYKNLTNFHYVELKQILSNKHIKSNRNQFWNAEKHSFDKICSSKIFRMIISETPGIIQKNKNISKGIPQGTNISGTFANIYMIDFDKKISLLMNKLGGYYRRYSDDILIITNNKEDLENIIILVKDLLKILKLDLSEKKTVCCKFTNGTSNAEICSLKILPNQNEFQYLGFTYDGKKILVRNGTMGCFWRDAFRHIRRIVLGNFKQRKRIPLKKIYGLYSHLSNKKSEYGNFYNYIRKAQRIMEYDYGFGSKVHIKTQMSKSWEVLHKYLWKLKCKYNIPDTELKMPRDLEEKFKNNI